MADESSTSLICEREIEPTLHVLWECPIANDIWGKGLNPLRKWSYQPLSCMDLREKLCETLELQAVQIVTQIFHNIWFRQNTFLFEEKFINPSQVYQNAQIQLEEFHEANKRAK